MTRTELEKVGEEIRRQGKIREYRIEEQLTGEVRLLVREATSEDEKWAPIRPAN